MRTSIHPALIILAGLAAPAPLAAQANQTAPAPAQSAPPLLYLPPVERPAAPPPRVAPAAPPAASAPEQAADAEPARSTPRRARQQPRSVRRTAPAAAAAAPVAAAAAPQPAPQVPAEDTAAAAAAPADLAPAVSTAPVPVTVADNATPAPAVTEAGGGGGGLPWLWILLGLVAIGGVVLFLRRRRVEDDPFAEPAYAEEPVPVADEAVAEAAALDGPMPAEAALADPAPADVIDDFAAAHPIEAKLRKLDAETVVAAIAATSPGGAPRALIETDFKVHAAGTDVVEAVVDFEMQVTNVGSADAQDVTICIWMSSASPYQDEEIAQFHADPPESARLPSREIAAGHSRPATGRIGIPKGAIHVVTVRDRPLFVPIVIVNIRWKWANGDGTSGEGLLERAFVIGTGKGEKLGPLWLDRGPRIHDDVDSRLHSERLVV